MILVLLQELERQVCEFMYKHYRKQMHVPVYQKWITRHVIYNAVT